MQFDTFLVNMVTNNDVMKRMAEIIPVLQSSQEAMQIVGPMMKRKEQKK